MTSSLPHRLHPAASARFTPEGTREAEPRRTRFFELFFDGNGLRVRRGFRSGNRCSRRRRYTVLER